MARWKFGWIHAMVALVLVMSLAMTGCTESEDDDDENEPAPLIILIDGEEFDVTVLEGVVSAKTIIGSDGNPYTGIQLSLMINRSNVTDPEQHQYNIVADDGYAKNVTWEDMVAGVLVVDGSLTSFPDLPGKYRIRDVVSIDPVDADTIDVNGRLYTTMQPFDIFADDLVEEVAENITYTGVRPSDLVNHTGLADGSLYNYTMIGSDGYNGTVNWTMMMGGVLVEDGMRTVFPELATSFWVSDVIEIEVI